MTFNEARNILAIMFYGTEEGKEINKILNKVDENPWRTDTPTEEGWYLCSTKASDFSIHHFDGNEWDFCTLDFVRAWQKIEPFKEDNYG